MIVCLCKIATHEDIADAISGGAHTVEQVGAHCGAGTGCGGCTEYIAEMIEKSGSRCPGGVCADCPQTRRSLAEPLPSREAA